MLLKLEIYLNKCNPSTVIQKKMLLKLGIYLNKYELLLNTISILLGLILLGRNTCLQLQKRKMISKLGIHLNKCKIKNGVETGSKFGSPEIARPTWNSFH